MSNQMLRQKVPLLLVAILLVGSMTEVFDIPLGQTFDLSFQLTQKGLEEQKLKETGKAESNYFDVIVVFQEGTELSEYALLQEEIGSISTTFEYGGEFQGFAASLTMEQIRTLQNFSFIKHIEFDTSSLESKRR